MVVGRRFSTMSPARPRVSFVSGWRVACYSRLQQLPWDHAADCVMPPPPFAAMSRQDSQEHFA
jgi:hypothetical protein